MLALFSSFVRWLRPSRVRALKQWRACAFTVFVTGAIVTASVDVARLSASNKINLQTQANGIQVLVNGVQVGIASSVNFVSGNGIVQACVPNGARIDCTPSYNTTTIATKATLESGACTYLNSTNGTTAYDYDLGPACQALTAYTIGQRFWLTANAQCVAFCSLNINKVGQINIKRSDGSTDPGGLFDFTQGVPIRYDGKVFRIEWQH
jgi:hypothetical protein